MYGHWRCLPYRSEYGQHGGGGVFLINNSNVTTHINVCNHFVRGCVEYVIINNRFVHLEGNLVGILTKSLPFVLFVKLASFRIANLGLNVMIAMSGTL